MRTDSLKAILDVLLAVTAALLCSHAVFGQTSCLTDDELKRMLAQVESSTGPSLDQKLRDRLLKLKAKDQKDLRGIISETGKSEELIKRIRTNREKNAAQLCPILKEFGWPTVNLVGQEGVDAAFFLFKNSSSLQLQRDLLPVIIAATKKGEIDRADFAGYIDRLRLVAGSKQLFGTQATAQNGFLVLYPIAAEAQVDERRKQYNLPPLRQYIRTLESIYRLPLVKSTGKLTNLFVENFDPAVAANTEKGLFEGETVAEDEVVRVETNLVSLSVSVYSNKLGTGVSPLEQKDFAVFEDGHQETISFFATTEVPADLVLLIDLSASTSGKRDLIRQTTTRFIEAARPTDRLAIVTFSDTTTVVSPLTDDRQKLLDSLVRIEGTGGSNVWDALKFTLDEVVGPRTTSRRRAVVFMTDGADNSLMWFGERGSKIEFSDLLEAVRQNDTLIVPIYLDTEGHEPGSRRVYESARNTLAMLAEESGGLYYKARKLEDLSDVYAQVIEDLGRVYSLGYKPTNAKRDGSWRTVKIELPNHPGLMTRARPGYYAK
jgi:Ca-activated chloride channel family protein